MAIAAVSRLDGLSTFAKKTLAAPDEVQQPIRSELFGAQRFEDHGRSLANAQTIRPAGSGAISQRAAPFFPRVNENIGALREAYDYIALTSRSGHYVTPAADWLLDNFHLIEAQLQQIREGVPHRYYTDLPKLADKPLEGLPRVYGIAWAYVAHTDSVLDPVLFTAFLHAYQEVNELTLGELWAFPTTLRVVLLENLRRMADRIARNKVAREVAHAAWDAADDLSVHDLNDLYAVMRRLGLQRSYLTQLWQRMPTDPGDSISPLHRWTEQHCTDALALIGEGQTAQVEANLTVGNIVTTLRLIGQVDWAELIEPVSHSLQVLRQLPSFSRESELTRQQLTQAMERLSQQTRRSERTVAQAVLALAGQGIPATAEATAGYFLTGAGRPQLEAALRPAVDPQRPLAPATRLSVRWRLPLYAGIWTVATLAALTWAAHGLDAISWQTMAALLLLGWPVSEAMAALLQRLIAEATRIQPLARLDFTAGIPADHRVLVVIPCLLTNAVSTSELVRRLSLHWLASREENSQFALLTDWSDAATESLDSDQALLDDAVFQIRELNRTYPASPGQPARFVLLHRPRSWSASERKWLGWERKRGKIELLIRMLVTGVSTGFMTLGADLQLASSVRYVLTLDSDTGLPAGSLQELVSIAAHPLNTPQIDIASRRVVAGYGLLQPRVVTPLSTPQERSPFHLMFAGQGGLDPYSSGAADLYQDLFGLGTFTGKGLLNIAAVHATLDDRLPEGTVLSHDLLEGSIARCGYVGDVVLMEDHPHHAAVAASRFHRWTRGDWQLLPLMIHARHFGIDALGLWRMADNLRRSLLAPACVLLLMLVIFTGVIPLAMALGFILCAYLAGPSLGALAALVPTRRSIALAHFFRAGGQDLWRGIMATVWQFSQLFFHATLMLDATARALWRMTISHRRLLEWTTAAQAQASAQYTPGAFLRRHALSSLACLALASAATQGVNPWAGVAIFLIWAAAPLTAWWASKPAVPAAAAVLSPADKAYLHQLARQTWQFFEHCISAEDNHLPPDNLQLEPEPTIAHRTSPTNIGLYLLTVASAREFGWITGAEMITRLEATLATVDRMPKHHGHLFNWYETRTLDVLIPAYVSTVDSGNLAGHLLATAQACTELASRADTSSDQSASLFRLGHRCEQLCMAMDFSGLYNARRHLFHIGLRVHEQALDASFYDLLASESRLTSFLAIAKGDVQRRHWQALGRDFLTVGVTPGLKSWSGSMFEYLMPCLVMTEPDQGLLHVSGLAAVKEQQAFGALQQLPWGVSESAYFAQDHSLAYQYSPFGAPRLALRRTPPTDRVVAPYATVMACMFTPRDAIANLRVLEKLGARGEYGFMDAVDFTVSRQGSAEAFSVVRNFMAHHQGMSLVALCNVLCNSAPRRWFAQAPLVQAYEALLHEKTPRQIIVSADPRSLPEPEDDQDALLHHAREVNPAAAESQPTQLLSNGRYSVALRANGAGVSRWRSKGVTANITRWRDDLLRDAYGSFIYLRAHGERCLNSVTFHPAPHPDWRYQATFMADRVLFETCTPTLKITTIVLVSTEDDLEMRTVSLQNLTNAEINVEVISCFEAVLTDARADEAHPAFSSLFLNTQWHPQWRALLISRKPRLHGDAAMSVAHFLADSDAQVQKIDFIADRRAFLGRNRAVADAALTPHQTAADGSPVNGLDPVAGLRVQVRLGAGEVARLSFATAAASTEEELRPRIDKYLQPMNVERAKRMAATLAQVRLRDLGIDPEENAALQDINTALLYSAARPTTDRALIDQRHLWRFGISGDKPIVLVRIHSSSGMALVHTLLRAQPLWTFGGISADLVIFNSEVNSYLMPLQRDILSLRDRTLQQVENSFPGSNGAGFYLLRDQDVTPFEKASLSSLARVIFIADGRPLEQQVTSLREASDQLHAPRLPANRVMQPAPAQRTKPEAVGRGNLSGAAASTLKGSFDATSGEFQFVVSDASKPARPWVNVISNPSFGFQISEAGAGYTWSQNSRLHQVTPWSNDPVQDPCSEHYLLQDLTTQQLVPLTPSTENRSVADGQAFRVRHGQGYTVFDSLQGELQRETTFFADQHQPVKVVRVRLQNRSRDKRKLRALAMVEWQLGGARHERRTVHGWKDADGSAVFAQQRESRAGFGGNTAFLSLAGSPGPASALQWTCDRSEFFNLAGQLVLPATLGRQAANGLDACAAVATDFSLAPGQTLEFSFLLGHAATAPQAQALALQWQLKNVNQALADVRAFWSNLLEKVQVRTPDPLFDALVNRWLIYQTLTSRLWSKAGFYQAGGASGFRDQLQDAMAFATLEPERLRAQILLNASRQFPEGDVQHWWHSPGGEGVRTHFSDDLLWLPFACAHYVEVTGDASVLNEVVSFIDGPAIPDGAEDAYYPPQTSGQSATVFEHCARAIDRSLAVGIHGLPLMGTGDWNDGMNRVGHEGKGESVWLGWFLCSVVSQFSPLAASRSETRRVEAWRVARAGWMEALHSHGWDGAWFRRAFFDNGEPLGSATNNECRIDLIAQAWAVLSGASTEEYTEPAMASMNSLLVDPEAGLLRLLAPPFATSENNPGYIQAYPPGVRENGGQYSHAAVWAMMAQAETGDAAAAWESFKALSPAHRSEHPLRGPLYELEPYVMAGDIYGAPPYVGRGGWSWYTGSAAWLHRAALENLIGLKIRPGEISLVPCLPAHWPQIELTVSVQDRVVHIRWQREGTPQATAFKPDRVVAEGEVVELDTMAAVFSLLVQGSAAREGQTPGETL